MRLLHEALEGGGGKIELGVVVYASKGVICVFFREIGKEHRYPENI